MVRNPSPIWVLPLHTVLALAIMGAVYDERREPIHGHNALCDDHPGQSSRDVPDPVPLPSLSQSVSEIFQHRRSSNPRQVNSDGEKPNLYLARVGRDSDPDSEASSLRVLDRIPRQFVPASSIARFKSKLNRRLVAATPNTGKRAPPIITLGRRLSSVIRRTHPLSLLPPYLKNDDPEQDLVVIKRFPQAQRATALNEARAMLDLADVGTTMRVYDVIEDEYYVCIVMQYFRGVTVHELLLDLVNATDATVGQVCDVLCWLAASIANTAKQFGARGILHTDLHVENVMIDDDLQVVVIDLGRYTRLASYGMSSPRKLEIIAECFTSMQMSSFQVFIGSMLATVEAKFPLTRDNLLQSRFAPNEMTLDAWAEAIGKRRVELVGDNARLRNRSWSRTQANHAASDVASPATEGDRTPSCWFGCGARQL